MSRARNRGRRHRHLSLVLALAVLGATAATAAEQRWTIGFGWGEADYGLTPPVFDDGSIVSGRVDNNELGWKIWAGYRINRWLSLEAGYVDLVNDFDGPTFEGISDGSGSTFVSLPDGPVSVAVAPSGYFLAGVASLPLGDSWSLLVRGGALRWQAEATTRDLVGEILERLADNAVTYGMGVERRWRTGLAVRGEYEVFTNVYRWDVDLITVGLSYGF